MIKIGFIGAGNMGSAIAIAVYETKRYEHLYVYDRDFEKAQLLAESIEGEVKSDKEIARECNVIFIGVKPNVIPAVAEAIASELQKRNDYVLVSMAAGVSTERLGSLFSRKAPIIRIMPNTPVSVGEGMILWCKNKNVTDEGENAFVDIMQKAGTLDKIDEELIDAGCAISGCGPAFVFMFIEAMAKAGEECGLSREKALLYATTTLRGASALVMESDKHPNELRDAVCSPGGSTIEGVKVLWAKGFDDTVHDAVIASYNKTKLLGK